MEKHSRPTIEGLKYDSQRNTEKYIYSSSKQRRELPIFTRTFILNSSLVIQKYAEAHDKRLSHMNVAAIQLLDNTDIEKTQEDKTFWAM